MPSHQHLLASRIDHYRERQGWHCFASILLRAVGGYGRTLRHDEVDALRRDAQQHGDIRDSRAYPWKVSPPLFDENPWQV